MSKQSSLSAAYTTLAVSRARRISLRWSCTGFSSTLDAREKHAAATATGSCAANDRRR
jgi:hypothetical protein